MKISLIYKTNNNLCVYKQKELIDFHDLKQYSCLIYAYRSLKAEL